MAHWRRGSLVGILPLVVILANGTAASAQAGGSQGAAPATRSRIMTSLTGYEVEEYLKRNDVLYVPVGPTEINGGNPIDVEYVVPLAYAIKLAEKTDGLVFPYLAYFYPGGTTVSPATVYMSTSDSLPYLKALTRSLIRQGFHRIVFLTSHGPSGNTMTPLVREIFDELHVPIVWMETSAIGAGAGQRGRQGGPATASPGGRGDTIAAGPSARTLTIYGAYSIVGRLEDMPVGLSQPHHDFPTDSSFATVTALAGGGNSRVGNYYADPSQHGGWVAPVTAEQRTQYAREGAAMIEAQVSAYDAAGLLEAIRGQAKFTKELEQRYGPLLPGAGR